MANDSAQGDPGVRLVGGFGGGAVGFGQPPRGRGWGIVAVAILVAVALVVSLAKPAEAADGDQAPTEFTVSFAIPENVDLPKLRGVVAELNSRHALLSDTLYEEQDRFAPVDLEPDVDTFTVQHDFDGAFAVTGSTLSLTVDPTNAVQITELTGWQWFLIYIGSFAVALLARILCEGFFGVATAGPGTILAAAFCAALGNFISTFIPQAVRVVDEGHQHDGGAWGWAVGIAAVASFFGVVWEGWAAGFARGGLITDLRKMGQALANWGRSLTGWASSASPAAVDTGIALEENAEAIGEGVASALEDSASETAAELRVLPLGDSITYGVGTPDNSSYRARLAQLLGGVGGPVNFVGSQRTGQLADQDNEGHPGWTISQIHSIASCTMREYRPNVVLLHIGTNDMARNVSVASAPERLRSLIRQIVNTAPETTVLVSTLIPSTTPATMNRIQQYNAAIPGIVADFQKAGRPVRLVDMGAVTPGDMTDSLHPNANGFRKMAEAFHRTIDGVVRRDVFLRARNGVAGACGDLPTGGGGGTTGAVDPSGTGQDGWKWEGTIASGVGATREEVRFADLNGDGRDDYLVVSPQGQVRAWVNNRSSGSTSWTSLGTVASGSAPREEVRFADVNGDGRDDYLAVGAQGQVRAWFNAGTGNSVSWASQGEIAGSVGTTREEVRFADINGDGRDDYLAVNTQGQVRAWMNVRGPGGTGWSYQGVVASGVGATRDEVRFTDLDGDSRDDYLVVGAQGQVRAWLNAIGATGAESWLVQGEIAAGVGVSRENVEFADIDGGGSSDYLAVNSTGQVSAWLNEQFAQNDRWDRQGVVASGTGVPPEELRFADLNGDRKEDYLAVGPQGAVKAWLRVSGGWNYVGQVASGAGPREEVRFADLNGDGRDDYLLVGAQGQVKLWLNVAGGSAGISFQSKGDVATGSGARDTVRFADINGDGRDDYLVVGAQGQVQGWLNTAGGSSGVSWQSAGEIAAGIGLPGSMITFADLDGDSRDDYLSVNEHGRIWAWLNNRGGGGSTWLAQGEIATGVGATRNQVLLADLTGDRRFDYLVSSATGVVTAWTGTGIVRKG
ncbi:lipolytic protein G-D-S-L family [Parafrankia colletiae]|uniref:Lipolytic protein G-D-S-L family n=1 Tax=Parafrankia colletiae TaxID=573497 RepID=A0A1S1QI19_9ACTN|nr:FG-GAP-like repeat-containing protein [Parafrankia colletiae]MCK9902882.1 FG-GAP-like repeat-containing protein [Frankia sp. Cpl3]OHV33071.1 lipolytic protein G-D-S-L family [Parafrankia colletiae]